jgi:hypothetical protein
MLALHGVGARLAGHAVSADQRLFTGAFLAHAPIVPRSYSAVRTCRFRARGAAGTATMAAMSEWGIALIAAGSAVAGSLVTGWYSRGAGIEQAQAARHAGDRQADALLETVRATLAEQAAARVLDLRRQTYVRFLDAAETLLAAGGSGAGRPQDAAEFQRALAAVTLEGPAEVARAAGEVSARMRRHDRPDDIEGAKQDFVTMARDALAPPPDAP